MRRPPNQFAGSVPVQISLEHLLGHATQGAMWDPSRRAEPTSVVIASP